MNSNWSYSPETVKLGRDLCDLDLWPWPFAWTSLLSLVITPENFMMIGWWEHSQKGVTDRQTDRRTDRQTDWTIHRAAWSQLKTNQVGGPVLRGKWGGWGHQGGVMGVKPRGGVRVLNLIRGYTCMESPYANKACFACWVHWKTNQVGDRVLRGKWGA